MPRKGFTLEEFQVIVKPLNIKVIEYKGVDHDCTYECSHGIQKARGWSLKKAKYCCRISYMESGTMWKKRHVH